MCKYVFTWIEVHLGIILLQGSSPTSALSLMIHVDPMKISFNPGENVTLTCQIQHDAPADVINWFKNNRPIGIQNDVNSLERGKILLLKISRNDTGKYKCMAWKNQESAKDEFNLYVNSAPVIANLPEVVEILPGEDRQITCQADGWPRPKMAWKLEDSYLSNNTRYEIRTHPTLNQVTLVIKSADIYHEHYYTCEASNAFGKTDSLVIVSFEYTDDYVKPTPNTEILVESRHVIASKGTNVTLKCNAININDPYSTADVWKFNGRLLDNQFPTHHKLRHTRESITNWTLILDIYNFSQNDAGRYECGVTDSSEASYMNTITLFMDEKDDLQNISANWKTVKAAVGTDVQLKCRAFHPTLPEADTFWLFQGTKVNVSRNARYKIDEFWWETSNFTRTVEMTFWISKLSVSDFGNYSCAVNTSLGLSSESVFLVQKKEKERGKENSAMLIITFPLVAGGLLFALAALMFLRKMHKKRRDLRIQEKTVGGEFNYDVFVTFSSKDRQWVSTKLTPLLERYRLKYCIHSRDFELGRALVDNMAESVYSSRKVLAVMSKNYLDSKFCRGELEMALYRSKVGRDGSLLVVTIDELKKNKLPKALRESTFVDYHSDTGRSSWEKKLIRFLVQEDNNLNVFNTKL